MSIEPFSIEDFTTDLPDDEFIPLPSEYNTQEPDMREVYIGKGKTIFIEPSSTHFKEYDWDKLQDYLDSGLSVSAGMKEDWYWTAKPLSQRDIDDKDICGLSASDWATPSTQLDDSDEFIDCYIIKEKS